MRMLAVILVLGVTFGCGGSGKPGSFSIEPVAAAADDGGDWSPEKGTATVKGTVKFEGQAPPRRAIDVGAEKFCVEKHKDDPLKNEVLVVGADGGLANVFVQVTSGLDAWKFPPGTGEVVLDQVACHYVPHMLGAQVGQTIKVHNSDPIMHNVHAINEKTEKDEFNWAQTKAGLEDTKDLKKAGHIVIKCDVHGWMGANLWIVKHPFFAVTGEDGSFALPKLPPGTYTIEAWHEKLGTQTATVTVADGDTKEIALKFSVSK